MISYEEFKQVELKVAKVLECREHPDADKLLVLTVDLGEEKRQIVAGLRHRYTPEELVGRLIVVVANLAPVKLRGEESQGMLLAASSGEIISVLQPDREVPPGSGVR